MTSNAFMHGPRRIRTHPGQLPHLLVLMFMIIGLAGIMILASIAGGEPAFAKLSQQHALRLLLGMLIALFLAFVPLRVWAALAYPVYFIIIATLVLVALFGVESGGATRWLNLGIANIQPSELMKIALPVALARHFHPSLQEHGRYKAGLFITALCMIILPVSLIASQPDLGTALMLALIGAIMLLMTGMSRKLLFSSVLIMAIAAPCLYQFGLRDYQKARVLTFLDPTRDPLGAGYQLQQAKIAIGSGGLWGKGYGKGTQSQLEYIPEQHTDFIFTLIGEEFGFFGACLLLLAWGVILIAGLRIAMRSTSVFGKLAAAGAVLMLVMHVIVNISMVTGLMPVAGMGLPLISYGGSALLSMLVAFGLLMAVHVSRDETIACPYG